MSSNTNGNLHLFRDNFLEEQDGYGKYPHTEGLPRISEQVLRGLNCITKDHQFNIDRIKIKMYDANATTYPPFCVSVGGHGGTSFSAGFEYVVNVNKYDAAKQRLCRDYGQKQSDKEHAKKQGQKKAAVVKNAQRKEQRKENFKAAVEEAKEEALRTVEPEPNLEEIFADDDDLPTAGTRRGRDEDEVQEGITPRGLRLGNTNIRTTAHATQGPTRDTSNGNRLFDDDNEEEILMGFTEQQILDQNELLGVCNQYISREEDRRRGVIESRDKLPIIDELLDRVINDPLMRRDVKLAARDIKEINNKTKLERLRRAQIPPEQLKYHPAMALLGCMPTPARYDPFLDGQITAAAPTAIAQPVTTAINGTGVNLNGNGDSAT